MLSNLQCLATDAGNDRNVPVAVEQSWGEYQQIVCLRWHDAAVGELQHAALGIHAAITDATIEKVFGMPVGVRHAVPMAFEIVAFDELNALIAKPRL